MTAKLPNSQAAVNRIKREYKRNAKHRNQEFELTDLDFFGLLKADCYYCGKSKSNLLHSTDFYYNGIDRLNPEVGYTTDNSVPCCRECNFAKQGMTKEQFLFWLNKTYTYLTKMGKLNDLNSCETQAGCDKIFN